MKKEIKKIAFVVGEFPTVSETWLLSQVTGLLEIGIKVDVYAFSGGSTNNISADYTKYKIEDITTYLSFPKNPITRAIKAIPLVFKLLQYRPAAILKVFNVFVYGKEALSLKLLFKVAPFVGKENDYDVIHCHFGTVAKQYLPIKEMLGINVPHVCTLYGYDISSNTKAKGAKSYAKVIAAFDTFLVMSNNMKDRVVAQGFPEAKVQVHPISIKVSDYHFSERTLEAGEEIRLTAVGRFVEKKGFDDLIRAIGIVKKSAPRSFKVDLIGDGELRPKLEELANSEDVRDVVDFRGYMKLEDVKKIYDKTHLYVQPSKTAADGDME